MKRANSIPKLVIPSKIQSQLLHENHNATTAAHFGITKTNARLSRFYYWPRMFHDVKKHITACHLCQQHKVSQQRPPGLMFPLNFTPGDSLCKSKKGNKFIVVFIDLTTRWVIAVPVKNATAKTITNAFYYNVILQFGTPEILLVDNGVQYVSNIFKSLCAEFKIKIHYTPYYHPQANNTERANRVIKTCIAIFCSDNQQKWDENINEILFALRTAKQESTKFSPAYLMLGRELRLPTDINTNLHASQYQFSPSEYSTQLKHKLKSCLQQAEKNCKTASETQAKNYNLRRRNQQRIQEGTYGIKTSRCRQQQIISLLLWPLNI
ncbi:hypothetical protein B566_EDAN014126 [Ephemera danica]|nr:hypothetical protein B566_EDAN014126 [Ephemera danica]